jgi:hypothetical protein
MQQVLDNKLQFDSRDRERLFDSGEASLDDVISHLTRTLAVRGNASCLVCGASFVRTAEGGASDSAECTRCGSSFE